jgi:hypothetical protein
MSSVVVLIVLLLLAYLLYTRRHRRRFRRGIRRRRHGGWIDFGDVNNMKRLLVSIGVLIVAGGVALLAMGGI